MTNANVDLDGDTQPLTDRIVAAGAYLSGIVTMLGFFVPLLFYFWKGKKSRFIGFHAVQAMLLGLATIFVYCALACISAALGGVLRGDVGRWTSYALVAGGLALPFVANTWMAISVVRGGRRVLPLLGRFTDEIIATTGQAAGQPDAAVTPEDRILGGSAYLSSLVLCLWFLSPLLLLLWKGRKSRFIAFHAIQAVLVDVALVPAMGSLAVLAFLLPERVPKALEATAFFAMWVLACFLPFMVNIWLGVRVMRGRPSVLFLLGRLARRLVPKQVPAASP